MQIFSICSSLLTNLGDEGIDMNFGALSSTQAAQGLRDNLTLIIESKLGGVHTNAWQMPLRIENMLGHCHGYSIRAQILIRAIGPQCLPINLIEFYSLLSLHLCQKFVSNHRSLIRLTPQTETFGSIF